MKFRWLTLILALILIQGCGKDSADSWTTFENQEYGYTLDYPSTWEIRDHEHHIIPPPPHSSVFTGEGTTIAVSAWERESTEEMQDLKAKGWSEKKLRVNGTTAVQYSRPQNDARDSFISRVYFPYGQHFIEISLSVPKELQYDRAKFEPLFDHIVKSFKGQPKR